MAHSIAPMLSVRNGARAVEFYKSAFGAVEVHRVEDPSGAVVSRLSIEGGEFWVSELRALDHFQAVGASRDERLAEAIEVVRQRRRADGRWPLDHAYRGKTYFELERVGAPSRWNTLRALRVLKWWDGRGRGGEA